MRTSAKFAAAALALVVIGGGVGGAYAYGGGSQASMKLCYNPAAKPGTPNAEYRATHCSSNWKTVELPAGQGGVQGQKGDKGDPGKDGDNALKVTHVSLTLNADSPVNGSTIVSEPCAGPLAAFVSGHQATAHCYKVTLTGAPAYSPTSVNLYGDNSGANTWAPDANVLVRSPFFSTPANGSTQRVFHVASYGFTNTKSFPLDIWSLSVVG